MDKSRDSSVATVTRPRTTWQKMQEIFSLLQPMEPWLRIIFGSCPLLTSVSSCAGKDLATWLPNTCRQIKNHEMGRSWAAIACGATWLSSLKRRAIKWRVLCTQLIFSVSRYDDSQHKTGCGHFLLNTKLTSTYSMSRVIRENLTIAQTVQLSSTPSRHWKIFWTQGIQFTF